MNKRPWLPAAVLFLLIGLLGVLLETGPYDWFPFGFGPGNDTSGTIPGLLRRTVRNRGTGLPEEGTGGSKEPDVEVAKKDAGSAAKRSRTATESLLDSLRSHAADPAVHNGELILIFSDLGAYLGFINDAQGAGVNVTGQIPELYAVRVRVVADAALNDALDAALMLRDVQLVDLDLNWKMQLEEVLGVSTTSPQAYQRLLDLLYQVRDATVLGWGAGMQIAFLDTGLALNTAQFFPRLTQIDIGLGVEPDDRHGMAIALLAAGSQDFAEGLTGIATAPELLSVRVTDSQGIPDVFAVAHGLVMAASRGADLIEVSPTSTHDALILKRALDYAIDRKSAAVIAARGIGNAPNWPAYDPRVIAVGAIDAFGAAPTFVGQSVNLLAGAPPIRTKVQVGPGLVSDYVAVETGPAGAAVVTASIAAVMNKFPNASAAEAWFLLQRSAIPVEETFLGPIGAGFRMLSLKWLVPESPLEIGTQPVATVADGTPAENDSPVPDLPASLGQPAQTPAFLPGTSSGKTATIGGGRLNPRGGPAAPVRGGGPGARITVPVAAP